MLHQDIESMQNHESFARIVQEIKQMREDCIEEMKQSNFENLQQVSGKIIAYDSILELTNWEKISKRFLNL
jgi:hypothetical protein|tara:strand:+ start:5818 stop:6030 length:213 start_codon:yes stop_codon:yes gene_type:complete